MKPKSMKPKSNLIEMFNLVKQNGGASYQIETGQINPTSGFMVSVPEYGLQVPIPTDLNDWQNVVLDYLLTKVENANKTIVGMLVDNVDLFLGAWIEGDSLYLDISENIQDFDTAVNLGTIRNQQAIFDCVNGQSFYL